MTARISTILCDDGDRPSATEPQGPASCAQPRWPAKDTTCTLESEEQRARLIGDICRLIREPQTPDDTRNAGLTLIGWLARRFPGETAHSYGVAASAPSEAGKVLRKGRAR